VTVTSGCTYRGSNHPGRVRPSRVYFPVLRLSELRECKRNTLRGAATRGFILAGRVHPYPRISRPRRRGATRRSGASGNDARAVHAARGSERRRDGDRQRGKEDRDSKARSCDVQRRRVSW